MKELQKRIEAITAKLAQHLPTLTIFRPHGQPVEMPADAAKYALIIFVSFIPGSR